jgi:3'(2'), 5'-bisphosphate nucleotidase
MSDAELAAELAEAAGRLLLDLRAGWTHGEGALQAAADRAANELIIDALHKLRPNDGLLSEESPDTSERLAKSRVWIVDPLDGTREYGEGRDDWAVHIGLAVGGAPTVGAVALPARGLVLRSDQPPVRVPHNRQLRLLISRTRPPALAAALAEAISAELVPMGSAGAKAMAVVLGEGDIYLHAGGQHEWDNCAPAAVALSAGLAVSRIDGAPLVYNRPVSFVPDLLICQIDRSEEILGFIARLR